MARIEKRSSEKIGLPPGTPVHVGKRREGSVKITAFRYSQSAYEEREVDVDELQSYKNNQDVVWINVNGIHDVHIIESIGSTFQLHPLVLEDIVNAEQRPKIEDYESYLFVVLKMHYFSRDSNDMASEQVSLILGKNLVISFQEQEGDVFTFVRDRIRTAKGQIRKMKSDYLFYSIIDAVVDYYFVILDHLEGRTHTLDKPLITDPQPEHLISIHRIREDIVFFRKSVWALREVLAKLDRGDLSQISKQTRLYIRDVYDHIIQVVEIMESLRDTTSGMAELYLSSVSNKMNDVMKTLTIIATIFIPLTFVAGVYGMNFKFMPELEWRWGYFVVLGIMSLITAGMVLFFRRRRWL